jgi:hypothetical protein
MTSPFPGMDPYLEEHWPDVHPRLVHDAANALQRQLTGPLRARIGERLIIEEDAEAVRSIYPDVRVFEHGAPGQPVTSEAQAVALAEPLVIPRPRSEEIRQTFVQIIDVASGGRLVTVIEFVSPSNKLPGDGQRKYRQKQQEILAADINLVEIDLTRGGERQLLYPPTHLPRGYQTTYLACVLRGFGFDRYEIYRMPLTERLPAIRIPLRKGDPDIALDIQPLVDAAYHDGRYDDIDYAKPCIPPLAGEEASWADNLLKAVGKR